jgi:hypothetical protein
MKQTKSSLHIWTAPPSILRSSGWFQLSLWSLILCFEIMFPYTHVPSFVILYFMKFVSTSAGFKRFAQMFNRSVHFLFKRKRSWNKLCRKTTPHAKNFSQDHETQSYWYSYISRYFWHSFSSTWQHQRMMLIFSTVSDAGGRPECRSSCSSRRLRKVCTIQTLFID